jgi:membrane protein
MAKPSSGAETLVASVIAAIALARSAGSVASAPPAPTAAERRGPARRAGGGDYEVAGTTNDDRRRASELGRGRQAESPTEIPAAGWKDITKRTLAEVKADNVPLLSAGVAFYSLLALFPALVAVVSIYGLVANPDEVATQLQSLTKAMPEQAAKLIIDQVTQIASSSSGALGVSVGIGIVAALWSASAGMKWLCSALSLVYDEVEDRKFVKLRATALLLTLGAAVGLVVSIALIAAAPSLAKAIGLGSTGALVIGIVKWPFLLMLVVIGFGLLYRYGPNRDQATLRWVSAGSVAAALIWLVASAGFGVYSAFSSSYSKNYGSFAGIIILMFWLYLTVFAVLFGAELNAEIERQTARDTTVGAARPLGQRDAVVADEVAPAET